MAKLLKINLIAQHLTCMVKTNKGTVESGAGGHVSPDPLNEEPC